MKSYENHQMVQPPIHSGTIERVMPVLEFENVTFRADHLYDSSVSEIDFTLGNGDLAIVLLEKEHVHLPLGDLADGIIAPNQGRVKLHNTSWLDMNPGIAADNRGQIGRVFEGNPWLDKLEVNHSIMLGQLHHTTRPLDDLARQASELSRIFGLPGLPLHLPSTFRGKDLARASCVRAFMGKPALLILERPTKGVYPELLPSLLNMLRQARNRGAAVLWLTDNIHVWNNPGVRPTLRGQMYGARMHMEQKECIK